MPVLTIRLTTKLHAAFQELALARYQSMNKLAVQLLSQAVRDNPDQQVLQFFEKNDQPSKRSERSEGSEGSGGRLVEGQEGQEGHDCVLELQLAMIRNVLSAK